MPLLHHDPDVLAGGGSGTRSGIPILFPFPNRIAGASFEAGGRRYDLPAAHPGDPNAIHGFCAKRPWSDVAATGGSAVTGTFRLSRDAPDVAADWPGDLELGITVELADDALRMESRVTNAGDQDAPFGLGFHPYFTALDADSVADVVLQAPPPSTGWSTASRPGRWSTCPDRDLRQPVRVADRELDDVLTGLPPFAPGPDGLSWNGRRSSVVTSPSGCAVTVPSGIWWCSPASRRTIAVEPYTCPTDAVHLTARGHDVGWQVLVPRGHPGRRRSEFTVS